MKKPGSNMKVRGSTMAAGGGSRLSNLQTRSGGDVTQDKMVKSSQGKAGQSNAQQRNACRTLLSKTALDKISNNRY